MELVDTFVGPMWLFERIEKKDMDKEVEVCSGYFLSDRIKEGNYENPILDMLANYLKPGMVCIDVGANVGVYSVMFSSKVGEEGKIYAFEPQKTIYNVLLENAKLYPNIIPHNFGLKDKPVPIFFKGDPRYILDTYPGDVTLSDVSKVDLIKIDTDGSEMGVLVGLWDLINRSPNLVMMVEYSPKHYKIAGYNIDMFWELIIDMGFSFGKIHEDCIINKNGRKVIQETTTRAINLLLWKDTEPFVKGM